MGIEGFHTWLKGKYPTCFVPTNHRVKYDYIYVDTNHILHHCIRNCDEYTFKDKLYNYLNIIFNNFFATKKVVLAIDGTSPYSKVILQRKRRLQNIRNINVNKINPLFLTPGTDLMHKIDIYLQEYVDNMKKQNQYSKAEYIVSPTVKSDEGEIKIFVHISEHCKTDPDSSHLVIGNDADLIVLAMAMKPSYNIDLLVKYKERQELVSINKLIECHSKLVLRYDDYNDEQKNILLNIHNLKNTDIRSDFVIISLMNGNDYLNKLYYINMDLLWKAYSETNITPNRTIIKNGKFNKDCFIEFLLNVVQKVSNQFKKPDIEKYSDDMIINYLEGLLWCLNMYQTGKCPMYDFIYKWKYSPSPIDLLHFFMFNPDYEIEIPKSDTKPLSPKYYTLLLMPYKAKKLVPKKYHNLIDGELKYLYEKELCKICNNLKMTLAEENQKIRSLKKDLSSLEEQNNNKYQKIENNIKLIQQNIKNINGNLAIHNKKFHSHEFSIKDVKIIIDSTKKII